jgi:RNA polymerase sigma-70 factor (ECF subfamily)
MVSELRPHPPGPSDLPDLELVRRFNDGDQDAFTALMGRHERRVFNLAYRMLGRREEALEATQEAFLSCFRHLRRFRGDSAFSTWLHRIAVNACYDMLRRQSPVSTLDPELVPPPPAPDHSDAVAAATDVQRALLEVPQEFRAVLILHDVQDLQLQDIAEALGVPVGTVKSRLHRGRVALGRALGVVPGEPGTAGTTSKPPNQ